MEIVQPSDRFSDEVSPYVDMKKSAENAREREAIGSHGSVTASANRLGIA
jgi:hypothetical protein